MAISRDKKNALVDEISQLMNSAKTTVFAQYQGVSVADLQELRRAARASGVTIKVVKNRLFRVALSEVSTYKDTDTSGLTGQLIYAVSADDEVAPAQVLNTFAKDHPQLQLVGGFSGEGLTLNAEEMINSNCSNFNPINYNILMVEDSKSLIKILNTSFKSLGFNTFLAMTLQEAREIIKINKIDYIILDINLPDGSGYDLIKELSTTLIKIIVLTSQIDMYLQN
jgi:ribosomal protein L10